MKQSLFVIAILILCGLLAATSQTANAAPLSDTTVFVEAEGFDNVGGWVVDTQMMHVKTPGQAGSPVLLAHGMGIPVANASTTVTLPKPGEYKVYARTRNWASPWLPKDPELSREELIKDWTPGKFRIIVDSNPLENTMGIDGDGWDWQKAGTITTTEENQKVKVELEDLTGFDGRVDALVFTQEDSCLVPSDPKDLEPVRHKALDLPDEVPNAPEEYELVVVGGGVPGCSAAISAARLGVKVALIQDRPVLGGNASTEVRVHICGKINLPPYTHLGDLVKEMGASATGNGQYNAKLYKDKILYDLVKAEKNITLYTCTHVYKVDKDSTGKKIVACYGQDIRTGAQTRFVGKWFVDCTGDAMLGYEAGADYHIGRESKSEFGEAAAPDLPDMMTMGASVMWTTIEDANPTTFPVLPWAHQFTAESAIPSVHGDWQWETGIGYNQVYDIERIRDNGLRALYGHWSYMKNQIKDGKWYDKCKNRKLGWVSWVAGKRESRRLMGDVVVKQQDIQGKKQWEDGCVTSSWQIDLHLPEARNHKFFPGDEFYSTAHYYPKSDYVIPYRALYSRNIDNLFMAGRNISVTHVGLGTVRVMRTGGMMGEVVGMAASLCKKYDTNPRGVYNFHLGELKKLMEKGIGK